MSSAHRAVTIAPEYFRAAVRDYVDPSWAVIREFFSNSRDAPGTTRIDITCSYGVFRIDNNGEPMTEDVILGKFLALGGTDKGKSKDDKGDKGDKSKASTVGGFGKAKELIMCQDAYTARTGRFLIEGRGGNFTLTEVAADKAFPGTSLELTLMDSLLGSMSFSIEKFLAFVEWDGEIFYNGVPWTSRLPRGEVRCTYPWGEVHVTDYDSSDLRGISVVRAKGIPMFTSLDGHFSTVVVEFGDRPSTSLLTSNRDGFVWPHYWEYDRFRKQLVMNRQNALKTKWVVTEYAGDRIRVVTQVEIVPDVFSSGDNGRVETESPGESPRIDRLLGIAPEPLAARSRSGPSDSPSPMPDPDPVQHLDVVLDRKALEAHDNPSSFSPRDNISVKCGGVSHDLGCRFMVATNLPMEIPDCATPVAMAPYYKAVAKLWMESLVRIHTITGRSGTFSVGFVFSADTRALYDPASVCYYVNPVKNDWSPAYDLADPKGVAELVACAAHEFVHTEHHSHDEAYAEGLTRVVAAIVAHTPMLLAPPSAPS